MIKRPGIPQLVLVAALLVGGLQAAVAADLGGSRAAAIEPEYRPAVWQGLYWGVTLNAVAAGVDIDKVGRKNRNDLDGGDIGFGGLVGYNFSNGPWVWGVEADINNGGLSEKKSVAGLGTVTAEQQWAGSLRLRGGYAWDRLMIYATAGLAISELDIKSSLGGKSSSVQAGLAAGFGAEYALDSNWRLRAETLVYGFETDDVKLAGEKRDISWGQATVRLGVTRKF